MPAAAREARILCKRKYAASCNGYVRDVITCSLLFVSTESACRRQLVGDPASEGRVLSVSGQAHGREQQPGDRVLRRDARLLRVATESEEILPEEVQGDRQRGGVRCRGTEPADRARVERRPRVRPRGGRLRGRAQVA